MSAPPAERVAELAPFWASVSVHEAGHAVVGVLLNVPVHHVRLDYQRMGLWRWEVVGYTGIGPDGRSAILDDHVTVPFTLAGLEAEAIHIASTTGIPLSRARTEVESRAASRGDVDTIALCLPDSGLTLDEARAWVHDTLLNQWQTVTYVAEALREQRFLPGSAIASLV